MNALVESMPSSIPAAASARDQKRKATAKKSRRPVSLVKAETAPAVTAARALRTAAAKGKAALLFEGVDGPDPVLMNTQSGFVNRLMDYYFRLEIGGWENQPKQPVLLVGGHSGGSLTMDAWTIAYAWWRHFQGTRTLHGTAHDVLMKPPGLGRYFRRMGVVSPTRGNIEAARRLHQHVV